MPLAPWLSTHYPKILAGLTAAAFIAGCFTTGLVQTIAFVAASIFAGWVVVDPLQRGIVIRLLVGFAVAAALFAVFRYVSHLFLPAPYPRDDGLIANFTSGMGGPARTVMGTQFSLFSDSTWNVPSKIWYRRVDANEPNDNGFLRIHYQLEPLNGFGPYAGLYLDFSFPPPTPFDLSRFRQVSMRIRSEPSAADAIDVGVVLYSSNVTNVDYAFPRWQIPRQNLRSEWTSVKGAFTDFVRPPFITYDVRLDPSRVYRLALILAASRLEPVHGHIDVDDLRFE